MFMHLPLFFLFVRRGEGESGGEGQREKDRESLKQTPC